MVQWSLQLNSEVFLLASSSHAYISVSTLWMHPEEEMWRRLHNLRVRCSVLIGTCILKQDEFLHTCCTSKSKKWLQKYNWFNKVAVVLPTNVACLQATFAVHVAAVLFWSHGVFPPQISANFFATKNQTKNSPKVTLGGLHCVQSVYFAVLSN